MTNKDKIRTDAEKHGLIKTVFDWHPVILADDTPTDIKCAWIRLHGQGQQDFELIKKWLEMEPR